MRIFSPDMACQTHETATINWDHRRSTACAEFWHPTRPHELPGTDDRGRALFQKLMIYTSERTLHDGEPVHRAIVRSLRASGGRGATVIRGIWGFHGDRPPHGDRLRQLGRSVPVVTVVIDTPDRIAANFDIVDQLTAEHGVVTSELVPALRVVTETDRRGGLRLARHLF
jgi:PII-like signaling protein